MAARNRSLRARNKTTTIGTTAVIALGGALGGLGCSRSTAPVPTASSTIVDTSTSAEPTAKEPTNPTDEAAIIANALAPYGVTLPNIARRTLYTWTKREQVEVFAKDPTLLTRAESPEHGTSYFEQVLDLRAQKDDALAKLLRTVVHDKGTLGRPRLRRASASGTNPTEMH
jgi:hypothetical protein